MNKLLVTLGAAGAYFLMGHIGLLAILVYVWASAMASTTNTAKTRAVETRVNNLVSSQTAQNQNISALQATVTALNAKIGTPMGGISGYSFTNIGSTPGLGTTPGGANAAWYQAVAAAIGGLYNVVYPLIPGVNQLIGEMVNRSLVA